MEFVGLERLIAAIGAALAAALTPIGVIYTATINRRNKETEASIAALNSELEKLGKRLAEAEARNQEEKRETLRWYQLSLLWFNHAHEMRRLALDGRQVAEAVSRTSGQVIPPWSGSLTLPLLEEPVAIPPKPRA